MPLFEFRCAQCGHEFEELVRSAEAAQAVACPDCRSSKVIKKFSTFGVATSAAEPACPSGHACRSCPHASPQCGLE